MKTLPLLLLLSFLGTTVAQDDAAPNADTQAADGGGDDKEDCEEAWEDMEFLKTDVKKSIEDVLQETLFKPARLLDLTVTNTMEQVLIIRDAVLNRVKLIRTGDESIKICPDQNIGQGKFLSELRLDIMTVLLRLIETDAATEDALQDIGRQLLSIRTKVNGEITRLIMLTDNIIIPTDVCDDCKFLGTVRTSLEEVITDNEKKEDGAEGTEIKMLTMLLMTIDARVGTLYNNILGELEEADRKKFSDELNQLKDIAGKINQVLSQMVDKPEDVNKINRLVTRDCKKISREVKGLLEKCNRSPGCSPSESVCDSCGDKKIGEVIAKLEEYNITLINTSEQGEAAETIRTSVINYLNTLNNEMTELLTKQIENADPEAENGGVEQCDKEELEVINSIKAPLWMVVNTTLFGNEEVIFQMLYSLRLGLLEMRSKYCEEVGPDVPIEGCDVTEIEQSYTWIDNMDKIIQENLFKAEKDPVEARKDALLGFVALRAAMETRVKELYEQRLSCPEEAHQIKHIYSPQLTECIQEMMRPKYSFETKSRADKVQCIKQLRVTIEQRRGELLLREIDRRIRERTADQSNSVANGKK